MTVNELIEKLKALHGDPDLRNVALKIIAYRPYASDAKIDGWLSDVRLDRGEAIIEGFIHLE